MRVRLVILAVVVAPGARSSRARPSRYPGRLRPMGIGRLVRLRY